MQKKLFIDTEHHGIKRLTIWHINCCDRQPHLKESFNPFNQLAIFPFCLPWLIDNKITYILWCVTKCMYKKKRKRKMLMKLWNHYFKGQPCSRNHRASYLHKVKPKPWFYTTSGLQAFSLRGLLELNRCPSTASFGFSWHQEWKWIEKKVQLNWGLFTRWFC